ncbi:Histidine kinase [Methylorubrum populi]
MEPRGQEDVVLLVEADPVVGLDLADALEAAGYRVTGPIRTAAEAEAQLAHQIPALAVLDCATTDDARLARTLHRRGVPFLVCAERDGPTGRSVEFTAMPWLSKPAWHHDVVWTMDELSARRGQVG